MKRQDPTTSWLLGTLKGKFYFSFEIRKPNNYKVETIHFIVGKTQVGVRMGYMGSKETMEFRRKVPEAMGFETRRLKYNFF